MSKKKRASKKKNAAKRREYLTICAIAIVVLGLVSVYTVSLQKKVDANREEIAQLDELINDENVRSEELEKQNIFMQSIEFIEKIARERLGLVKPGETIVKPAK